MVYTEIKERNGIRYYYRVMSIREGKKFKKKRIYLGRDLSRRLLSLKESEADSKLNFKKINKKSEAINKIAPLIKEILKKNNVKRAGIFGSYAHGEQKKSSDIDILVEPPKGIGFGFAGIQFELEKGLGKKVHLVTYNSIHHLLKDRILKEEVRII